MTKMSNINQQTPDVYFHPFAKYQPSRDYDLIRNQAHLLHVSQVSSNNKHEKG